MNTLVIPFPSSKHQPCCINFHPLVGRVDDRLHPRSITRPSKRLSWPCFRRRIQLVQNPATRSAAIRIHLLSEPLANTALCKLGHQWMMTRHVQPRENPNGRVWEVCLRSSCSTGHLAFHPEDVHPRSRAVLESDIRDGTNPRESTLHTSSTRHSSAHVPLTTYAPHTTAVRL